MFLFSAPISPELESLGCKVVWRHNGSELLLDLGYYGNPDHGDHPVPAVNSCNCEVGAGWCQDLDPSLH